MNLNDRIAQYKAEFTDTPEGRKKGIKVAIGVGCLALALVVGAVQLLRSSPEADRGPVVNQQMIEQLEAMAEEFDAATELEAEAFEDAIAAGEVDPPEPPPEVVRSHPKGAGYIPGTASDPAHQPSEPEPDPEDPG